MTGHQWFYLAPSTNDPMGPVSESKLLELARNGTVRLESKIASPSRTGNAWIDVRQVQGVVSAIQQGEAARQRQREVDLAQRQADREVRNQQRAIAKQQADEAAAARREAASPEAQAREKVQEFLVQGETIELIVVQNRLTAMSIWPDAVVATNRRLIHFRAKLTGWDFTDMPWLELSDAQVRSGLLGATFKVRHVSGQVTTLENLPTDKAAALYRLAQQREEEAREFRRQRAMEERRAGVAQFNINTATAAETPKQEASDDVMHRLTKLKNMLDAGLISQDDFDRRKEQILGEI